MKKLLCILLICTCSATHGQNTIEWDGVYQLQLSDFQSPASQIGDVTIYSLHFPSSIDFSFYMTNGEFMFTKNFNSKVKCVFQRNASSIIAPDSIIALDVLNFGRFTFDLSELYARKLRLRLKEEKNAFSDAGFFRPVFEEIQKEYTERHAQAGKLTDIGRNDEKLKELHQEVLAEIALLSEYCKTCKPKRKN